MESASPCFAAGDSEKSGRAECWPQGQEAAEISPKLNQESSHQQHSRSLRPTGGVTASRETKAAATLHKSREASFSTNTDMDVVPTPCRFLSCHGATSESTLETDYDDHESMQRYAAPAGCRVVCARMEWPAAGCTGHFEPAAEGADTRPTLPALAGNTNCGFSPYHPEKRWSAGTDRDPPAANPRERLRDDIRRVYGRNDAINAQVYNRAVLFPLVGKPAQDPTISSASHQAHLPQAQNVVAVRHSRRPRRTGLPGGSLMGRETWWGSDGSIPWRDETETDEDELGQDAICEQTPEWNGPFALPTKCGSGAHAKACQQERDSRTRLPERPRESQVDAHRVLPVAPSIASGLPAADNTGCVNRDDADGDNNSPYHGALRGADLLEVEAKQCNAGLDICASEEAEAVTAGMVSQTAAQAADHPDQAADHPDQAADHPDLLSDEMIARELAATFAAEERMETGNDPLVEALSAPDAGYIPNIQQFECQICYETIKTGDGVMLRECLHMFCRDCLANLIKHCEEAVVRCPHVTGNQSCDSPLQHREIQLLVDEEFFQRHLNRGLAIARTKTENSFQCRTPNCSGWCIYEPDSTIFHCQICDEINCLNCKAIHTGRMCMEFQDKDMHPDTQLMMQSMVDRGEGMRCPSCGIFLLRQGGCDWLRCSMCRTEICWVTRGPRWGPKGRYDISGGCRCRVNGRKCHPSCVNCH